MSSESVWRRVTDATTITASDQVKLQVNGRLIAATVKFVGNLKSKGDTVFYGVELQESKSKGDGSHKGVQYFQCVPRRGVFLKRRKLIEHRVMDDSVPRLSVKDVVKARIGSRHCRGVVKYVGIVHSEAYFGLALDNALGDSDGCLFGQRYFEVRRNCAFFAKATTPITLLKPYMHSPKRSKRKKTREVRTSKSSDDSHKAGGVPKQQIVADTCTQTQAAEALDFDEADEYLKSAPRCSRAVDPRTSGVLPAELKRAHTKERVARGHRPSVVIDIKVGSHSSVSLQLPVAFKFATLIKTLETEFGGMLPEDYDIYFSHLKTSAFLTHETLEEICRKDPLFHKNGQFSLKKRVETPKAKRGLQLMEEGQMSSALRLLREAIATDAESKKALLAAGKCCCLSEESFAEAERHFGAVLSFDQKNVEAWIACGLLQEARHCYEAAKRCYENALKHGSVTSPMGGVALLRLRFTDLLIDNERKRVAEMQSLKKQISSLESQLDSISSLTPSTHTESEHKRSEHSLLGASSGHSLTEFEQLTVSLAPKTPKMQKDKLLFASDIQAVADVSNYADKIELIIDKLLLCGHICDFNDENIDEKIRIANKRDILAEVSTVLPTIRWTPHLEVWDACFQVIAKNLFRSLPEEKVHSEPGHCVEEPDFEDPSFEHLQLVYALLMHVVTNTAANKRLMTEKLRGDFLKQLTWLFAATDTREAELVKHVMHVIYGRFMALRKEIRRHLSDYCYAYIYGSAAHESKPWRGIPEIVEMFCSIFTGLKQPVKPMYRVLLRNVIVPLHKMPDLEEFFDKLLECVLQFTDKDPKSMAVVIGGLLRFWPKASSSKQLLFLEEVMNLLSLAMTKRPKEEAAKWRALRKSDEFVAVVLKALDVLIQSMESSHVEVAEKFTLVWKGTAVKRFADRHKAEVWPTLYATLRKNSTDHWLQGIRRLNKGVLDEMRTRDEMFFKVLEKRYDAQKAICTPTKLAPSDACDEDSKTEEYCEEESGSCTVDSEACVKRAPRITRWAQIRLSVSDILQAKAETPKIIGT